VHFGQPATITLDAVPGRTFQSSIVQVNPSADPSSRQFSVRAALANPGNAIKPGMFAKVTIVIDRVSSAVVVPREAVATDAEKGSTVTLVDTEDIAHVRQVTTGASDARGVAITQGVMPGDKIVILSANAVKDGAKVRVGGRKRGGDKEGGGAKGGEGGEEKTPGSENAVAAPTASG
jgi:RND family efflux transporter MFP subunit